jgi:hypothetical protein
MCAICVSDVGSESGRNPAASTFSEWVFEVGIVPRGFEVLIANIAIKAEGAESLRFIKKFLIGLASSSVLHIEQSKASSRGNVLEYVPSN